MYLKEIATCKGRCSLHSRAHDGTRMWLFQTQRTPAPYRVCVGGKRVSMEEAKVEKVKDWKPPRNTMEV
jgi:hypothetical protein